MRQVEIALKRNAAQCNEAKRNATKSNALHCNALNQIKKEGVPIMHELLTLSGKALAGMIKTGEVSSREVVEKHIEQIEKVNPQINAVVADRFQEARKEADEADRLVKSCDPDELPLYHGVPCTIKECIALTGMPNTCGVFSRKGFIPEKDATVVERLRKAGVIPLGVTNLPELCLWFETYSHIYGRCNNPYDCSRITGGSSGGEGAIIGAGGSPFGLGSDIAGSIRFPAFFNGVFGHKPTGGLVPNTGHYPILENNLKRYLTTGPLARRAEDLIPVLKIIAGPDGTDEGCTGYTIGDPASVELKDMSIISIEDHWFLNITPDLRQAQRRCADYLETRGARVLRGVRFESVKKVLGIWFAMVIKELENPIEKYLGAEQMSLTNELLRAVRRDSTHIAPIMAFVLLDRLLRQAHKSPVGGFIRKETDKFVETGLELKKDISNLLGDNGVIIYPSYTSTAPVHGKTLKSPLDSTFMFLPNVLELPATQIPLGLSESTGLPTGIQIIGNHGRDHVTVAVAMALEKRFGGWISPEERGAAITKAMTESA